MWGAISETMKNPSLAKILFTFRVSIIKIDINSNSSNVFGERNYIIYKSRNKKESWSGVEEMLSLLTLWWEGLC